jgi:hypothetical protein
LAPSVDPDVDDVLENELEDIDYLELNVIWFLKAFYNVKNLSFLTNFTFFW